MGMAWQILKKTLPHLPRSIASTPPNADRPAVMVRQITGCQSAPDAYVGSVIGSSAEAADVLQETNVALWEKADEYDTARPFLPWAYQFAWFEVLAYRKRQS